ncbi:hypothetical protein MNB_SV-3-993 [hydrothermal vent metagenome]|uniref:Uncharacterized protein n=1 Tax=hydrothermal vent metagenome TaxID=652676 RepID=A0A1W1BXS4_9ZZZZ
MSKTPKRNTKGQPYGVALEELGKEYVNSILSYYDGRMRRFGISATRLKNNLNKDIAENRKVFSETDLKLISRLNNMSFDAHESNEHIVWIIDVFNSQKNMIDDEINPLTKELVNEFDYVFSHEKGGFLNDGDYQTFRQVLIGKLAEVYGEPINFLGVILRTLVLSVATADI